MNRELQEKIQAWVDGELKASEAHRIATLTQSDPAALALAENLRGFRSLVRDNAPEHSIDASRDFYWSRIREGIHRAERATASPPPEKGHASIPSRVGGHWLAWLVPSALVATAAFFALRPGSVPTAETADPLPPVLVDHVVESPLAEVTTLTFYSSSDAMTVVWVGSAEVF